jgi:hypothetical protein
MPPQHQTENDNQHFLCPLSVSKHYAATWKSGFILLLPVQVMPGYYRFRERRWEYTVGGFTPVTLYYKVVYELCATATYEKYFASWSPFLNLVARVNEAGTV